MMEDFKAIEFRNDELVLIDQRILPEKFEYTTAKTVEDIYFAIRDMIVRGAPAIGGTAGYGVYFAAKEAKGDIKAFNEKCDYLSSSRPTAVNLSWAVERCRKVGLESDLDPELLLKEADAIVREDIEMNLTLSRIGAKVVPYGGSVLTHCNAGALATCGWGTAVGVIKMAWEEGRLAHAYADETRPRFQGARLTAWELVHAKIPSTLIPDSAAATLIRQGRIDCVILGADRITTNGDVANKLGTFPLSIVCKEYGVPFYSVAPTSTIDFSMADGKDIPIEERSKDEVIYPGGGKLRIAPLEIDVFNPAFDMTPHQNITGIITEKGIIRPPFNENIERIRKGEPLIG